MVGTGSKAMRNHVLRTLLLLSCIFLPSCGRDVLEGIIPEWLKTAKSSKIEKSSMEDAVGFDVDHKAFEQGGFRSRPGEFDDSLDAAAWRAMQMDGKRNLEEAAEEEVDSPIVKLIQAVFVFIPGVAVLCVGSEQIEVMLFFSAIIAAGLDGLMLTLENMETFTPDAIAAVGAWLVAFVGIAGFSIQNKSKGIMLQAGVIGKTIGGAVQGPFYGLAYELIGGCTVSPAVDEQYPLGIPEDCDVLRRDIAMWVLYAIKFSPIIFFVKLARQYPTIIVALNAGQMGAAMCALLVTAIMMVIQYYAFDCPCFLIAVAPWATLIYLFLLIAGVSMQIRFVLLKMQKPKFIVKLSLGLGNLKKLGMRDIKPPDPLDCFKRKATIKLLCLVMPEVDAAKICATLPSHELALIRANIKGMTIDLDDLQFKLREYGVEIDFDPVAVKMLELIMKFKSDFFGIPLRFALDECSPMIALKKLQLSLIGLPFGMVDIDWLRGLAMKANVDVPDLELELQKLSFGFRKAFALALSAALTIDLPKAEMVVGLFDLNMCFKLFTGQIDLHIPTLKMQMGALGIDLDLDLPEFETIDLKMKMKLPQIGIKQFCTIEKCVTGLGRCFAAQMPVWLSVKLDIPREFWFLMTGVELEIFRMTGELDLPTLKARAAVNGVELDWPSIEASLPKPQIKLPDAQPPQLELSGEAKLDLSVKLPDVPSVKLPDVPSVKLPDVTLPKAKMIKLNFAAQFIGAFFKVPNFEINPSFPGIDLILDGDWAPILDLPGLPTANLDAGFRLLMFGWMWPCLKLEFTQLEVEGLCAKFTLPDLKLAWQLKNPWKVAIQLVDLPALELKIKKIGFPDPRQPDWDPPAPKMPKMPDFKPGAGCPCSAPTPPRIACDIPGKEPKAEVKIPNLKDIKLNIVNVGAPDFDLPMPRWSAKLKAPPKPAINFDVDPAILNVDVNLNVAMPNASLRLAADVPKLDWKPIPLPPCMRLLVFAPFIMFFLIAVVISLSIVAGCPCETFAEGGTPRPRRMLTPTLQNADEVLFGGLSNKCAVEFSSWLSSGAQVLSKNELSCNTQPPATLTAGVVSEDENSSEAPPMEPVD